MKARLTTFSFALTSGDGLSSYPQHQRLSAVRVAPRQTTIRGVFDLTDS